MLEATPFLSEFDSSEIGCSTQTLEYGPCRVELQIGAVLVSEGAAGQSNQHAHARSGVGHLDPLPHFKGAAQRVECGLRLAFGQVRRSARLRGNRIRHSRIEAPGNVLQLSAGVACVLEITGGQHDLDIGGQQAHTFQPIHCRVCDATNGGGGRVGATLHKAQQR